MSTHGHNAEAPETAARRTRGQRAGLDLQQIVVAARGLPPTELSMSAVADVLGVDRKALHNYVPNREALVGLVAGHRVAEALARLEIPPEADWQELTRSAARGMHAGYVEAGHVVEFLIFGPSDGTSHWQPFERLLQAWLDAGFSRASTLRGLYALGSTVWTHARDTILNSRDGGHPQLTAFRTHLDAAAADEFPVLAGVLSEDLDPYDEDGFEFLLQIFLDGMERVLASDSTGGGSAD